MPTSLAQLRNLGVIAHIDAGKTTLTERMLYYSGCTHRVGEVDKGTTITDYDPEEQERGITIQAACVTFPWKVQAAWRDAVVANQIDVNLIDTPGHVDFTAEVERSLRVLDGGVVVFSAREGVEAQSETVWRQADKYHVPRLAFINKMDREGADFFATLAEIRERLNCCPVPVTLPVGAGPPHVAEAFRGIVDLLTRRYLVFEPASQGASVRVEPVPAEVAGDVETWRTHLLDRLSLYNDELTHHLLAETEVPLPLIHRVLRDATLHNLVVPVFCGSALDGIGVQPLLDGVAAYLPSPTDVPPVVGGDPASPAKKVARKPSEKEPFCGLVFKIQADRHGDLHYLRVYSGRLKANSRVLNPGKGQKENIPQLWRIQADRRTQIEEVVAGEIVGVIGLRHTITGDTLCDAKEPVLLESIAFPDTVIAMAIEPESTADRKKLAEVLDMLKRQDPTFRAQESAETGQTLISGMGELHLEVIKHWLLRDYKLNVRVHKPRVSYRETIQRAVELCGECRRNVAGSMLSAGLRIRMEPWPQGAKAVTVLAGPEAIALPPAYLTAATEVLAEQGAGGGQLGFPLIQVKITVLGGTVHETESNELAFRFAAGDAFEKALREAGPVLLEPVMRLEVTMPEEHLGDIVGDLQQRRATIVRTSQRGKSTVIEAHAPLASLFGYSSVMRGLTQGRATCTMEPHSYGPAPAEVLAGFM